MSLNSVKNSAVKVEVGLPKLIVNKTSGTVALATKKNNYCYTGTVLHVEKDHLEVGFVSNIFAFNCWDDFTGTLELSNKKG